MEKYKALLAQNFSGLEVLENIREVFFVTSPDGSAMHYISPAYEDVWGRGRESLYKNPRSWMENIHPDDQPMVLETLRKAPHQVEMTYRLIHPSGITRWISARTFPVRDDAGRVLRVVGIAEDITVRKSAEDNQLRLRKAVENSGEVVFMTDEKGLFTYVNPAFTRLYGYEAEEILAKATPRILKGRARSAEEYADFWRKISSGQVVKGEWTNRTKNGNPILVEYSANPVYDDRGTLSGFLAIQKNVTAERAAEASLRLEKEKYKVLMESAPEAILVFDAGAGLFADANRSALALFGWPIEQIRKMGPADLSPALQPGGRASAAASKAHVRLALRGESAHFEWACRDAKGREFPCEVWGIRLPSVGLDLIRMTVTDISARRTMENALRQSQKMEAVGQLAGGVAHDFNNLLTVILGYSNILLSEIKDDAQKESLLEVKKAGERAAALTRQLLAFSRRQLLQPKLLDLNGVLSDVEKMLGRLIGENIRLSTVLKAGLGPIKADPGQVEQVIMNLVVNARDAMPQGGKLIIETAEAVLGEEFGRQRQAKVAPGRYAVLSVGDTGTGMTPEVQAHIFEPFFTTKEAGKGTGLGLSTVYGIVKQSGGHIWVESEPGKGTTFTVYFPLAAEVPAEGRKAEDKPRPAVGSETLLLVEDEPAVRELIRSALAAAGYKVLSSAGGKEALVLVETTKETIRLVVTDLVMPDISGFQMADRLRKTRPDLKVLFMSGYTDHALLSQEKLGPDLAFLQKPFFPDTLIRKVRELLNAPAATA